MRPFLTESCADAPAETPLDVWGWWSGSFTFPDRPRGHPDFPRAGLRRYTDDPRPRYRLLALDDPGAPTALAALAVRLAADPDPAVRARAAGDPPLPSAATVTLLRAPGSAADAARNPALPLPVVLRMAAG
ncbi:hypothetical protein [Kitasatospora saccharophila]|uniref:hypothetical protein n=1 Tax=Kitasatospora saccharophila TaxID=407973 RepID=UPI0031DB0D0A